MPIQFWMFASRPVVTVPRFPSNETPVWRQTKWHRRRRIWDLCGLHDGVKCEVVFPTPLPDDPQKWDGWNKYKSTNPYERLCLDAQQNPTNELIEEHCRELLRWWQKKLPLKNQPSNPVAQLLGLGLDESSRYLTEARVELLDPLKRKRVDDALAAKAREQAVLEFHKFLTFSLADGTLGENEEKSLLRFGAEQGLSEEQMLELIEKELEASGAMRVQAPEPGSGEAGESASDPKAEFMRMLRFSGLNSETMTDDQRDAFINVAENSGLDPGDAEDMVDDYLEEIDKQELAGGQTKPPPIMLNGKNEAKAEETSGAPAMTIPRMSEEEERRR